MRKGIVHLKKSDPVLAALIERVGPFRMNYDEPGFHHLAEAIVYQQLHGKAAATIFKRLTDLAGSPLTPEGILKLSEDELRGVGLGKSSRTCATWRPKHSPANSISANCLPFLMLR